MLNLETVPDPFALCERVDSTNSDISLSTKQYRFEISTPAKGRKPGGYRPVGATNIASVTCRALFRLERLLDCDFLAFLDRDDAMDGAMSGHGDVQNVGSGIQVEVEG
jgi:hypothetical protein